MAWLLDTMVLSEGRRPRPEPKVIAFLNAQSLDEVYIIKRALPLPREPSNPGHGIEMTVAAKQRQPMLAA